MTHTPGPWVVVGGEYDDVRIITLHPMPEAEHAYGDQTVVGSSEWTYMSDEDAHLIAAAPDLLAALEALIAAIENQRYGDDRLEDDIYGATITTDSPYTVAIAAIAKARNTPALHVEVL